MNIIERKIPETKHELNDLHPVIQKIFLTRGISKKHELEQELNHLLPYDQLLNIGKSSEILYNALINNKKIVIIGDFDADGATSTSLAVSALKQLKANINYLVPNRFEYGYGLTPEIVDLACEKFSPDLIITVDNGIASVAGVERANELNIDVLITDHHLPGEKLPDAVCIVNPNQPDDKFPSKNLAGVGVIFYVLLSLRAYLRSKEYFSDDIPDINMAQFLDLVALGTVADLVPLDYNNRILVSQGIKRIKANKCRNGIKALFQVAKRDIKKITAGDLGFAIGPRLNAAGRIEDMSIGIECLLSDNLLTATKIASELNYLNNKRRSIENDMKKEALVLAEEVIKELIPPVARQNPSVAFGDISPLQKGRISPPFVKGDAPKEQGVFIPHAFCLYKPNWHQGVIGIVASRIKELYNRPTIIFADDNDEYIKGSCRSIEGLHIKDALDLVARNNPGLLPKFGGHAMAAGLSIKRDDFAKFHQEFVNVVESLVSEDILENKTITDGVLQHYDLNLDFAKLLERYGPWGQKFPEPLFYGDFFISDIVIIAEKHLKFMLTDLTQSTCIKAMYFNGAENIKNYQKDKIATVVYKLNVNEFNNLEELVFIIDSIEVS